MLEGTQREGGQYGRVQGEIALEVHLRSVPYGLVVLRRRFCDRVITPRFPVERLGWETAGTTPPLSLLSFFGFVICCGVVLSSCFVVVVV